MLTLADEIQPVVDHHATDYQPDQGKIERANDRDDFSFSFFNGEMDRSGHELLCGVGMTFTARLRKIGRIDHRGRIARRQNIVNSVAACAICHSQPAGVQRETVKASLER